jgi:hypothetical protein
MENCATGTAAFKDLLNAEYGFGQRARLSVPAAFLEFLADDGWVLEPTPKPGRPFYEAFEEGSDHLERYPAMADLAGSLDLGFTAGPWIYTAAAGGGIQIHGHFVTIWRRDSACRWRVEFDGGISHAAPAAPEPELAPDRAARATPATPPPNLVADDAGGGALSDFQNAARQDGVAAGLRTYARTADFRYYTESQAPMALGAANRYLSAKDLQGTWQESVRGRSTDASLLYTAGIMSALRLEGSHVYLQVWQYDSRVANWGLRILLINPVPSALSK